LIKRPTVAHTCRAATRLALAFTLATLLAGCADVPAAFGPTSAQARANADGLFGAFVRRFTNVERTPRYARAREMLLHYALTPSQVYSDTSIWTSYGPDGYRTLFGNATFRDGRYVFSNTETDDPVKVLGEGRHIMRLHKVSNDDYDCRLCDDHDHAERGAATRTDRGNDYHDDVTAAQVKAMRPTPKEPSP